MSQYILIIGWIAIIYMLSHTMNVYRVEHVLDKREVKLKVGFVIFSMLPLIWWTITRDLGFGDTDAYKMAFEELPTALADIFEYLKNAQKDKGFYAFSILIKRIVGNRYELYFAILAMMQGIIVAMVFRKYSSNYILAIFLFVTTTDYLSWMHNGVRQFTAVVLIFAATELMLKKKYVPLIAVILLAATMHGSALLMIPIVFMVQGEPLNRKTVLAIIAFVIAIVFVDKFTNILDVMLEETQYTNVVSDWQAGGDDGTNPIRVLVYSVPTILSLIGFRFIKAAKDPVINMACNMSILSTMLYCLSAVTSGIFIGRLPIYCSM